jgi:hypothetical protein
MTAEQRLRGRDARVDRVVIVSAYRSQTLDALAECGLFPGAVEAHGAAPGSAFGRYRLACCACTGLPRSSRSAMHR